MAPGPAIDPSPPAAVAIADADDDGATADDDGADVDDDAAADDDGALGVLGATRVSIITASLLSISSVFPPRA